MAEAPKGRESFLAASQLLDSELKATPVVGGVAALTWAREQIRLQAIQHIRSLAGRPNAIFMANATSAIHALDNILGQPADPESPAKGTEQ